MATIVTNADTIAVSNKAMDDNGIAPLTLTVSELPAQSVASLIQRGASHYFGNVFQSALLSAERKAIAGDGKVSDVTEAMLTTWRGANVDMRKGLANETFAGLVAAVRDGTIGMPAERSSDVARDPVEAEMRALAIETIRKVFAQNDRKIPAKFDKPLDGMDPVVDPRTGETVPPTVNVLVARQFARDPEGYRKRAEALIAARSRAVGQLSGGDTDL